MIRSLVCAVLLLAALPLATQAGTANYASAWNGAEINWRDPRSGISEATKTNRPVLMVFHATWCSFCRRFQRVFKDPAIVAASRDFVMILADVDTEKELNGAFSPDGTYVPRTLFIDPEGNVSNKLVGPDPQYPHSLDVDSPAELLALMKKAHQVFKIPSASRPAAGANPI